MSDDPPLIPPFSPPEGDEGESRSAPFAVAQILWRFEESADPECGVQRELSWGIGDANANVGWPVAVDLARPLTLETGWSAAELSLEKWTDDLSMSWLAVDLVCGWRAEELTTGWSSGDLVLEA